MVIMAQSGKWISSFSQIKKIFVSCGPKGAAVIAGYPDGDSTVCGTYSSEYQCMLALGQLYSALADGELEFEFPQPESLPTNKSHYGAGGGRRHGGS